MNAVSSNGRMIVLITGVMLAGSVSVAVGQTTYSRADFTGRGVALAAAVTHAPLPEVPFGALSLTGSLGRYAPATGAGPVLVLVLPQWWLSTNLSLFSTLGHGADENQIVEVVRVGLRYLPASLHFRGLQPSFELSQTWIAGLQEMKLAKWNAYRWTYSGSFGSWLLAGGLRTIQLRLFTRSSFRGAGVPGTIEATINQWSFAAGYPLQDWLQLTGQLLLTGSLVTAGMQISLAL